MASWFDQGYAGAQEEQAKRDLGYPPNRLWLKAGANKEVIFVDDSPFCIREHSWKGSDDKYHQATCIAKLSPDGCPGCGAKGVNGPDYIGFLTVVDVSGYTARDGEQKGKFELMLLAPKTQVMNKLRSRKENRGSLVGMLYNLSRTSAEAASTGDDIEFIREAKMDGLYAVVTFKGKNLSEIIEKANGQGTDAVKARKFLGHYFQIPEEGEIPAKIPTFNYESILEPLEPGEFRGVIAGAQAMPGRGNSKTKPGSGSSGGGGLADDVPF